MSNICDSSIFMGEEIFVHHQIVWMNDPLKSILTWPEIKAEPLADNLLNPFAE